MNTVDQPSLYWTLWDQEFLLLIIIEVSSFKGENVWRQACWDQNLYP